MDTGRYRAAIQPEGAKPALELIPDATARRVEMGVDRAHLAAQRRAAIGEAVECRAHSHGVLLDVSDRRGGEG
ncbi:MAG TPA: hypothetical protein VLS27_17560 [Gammaproteobacteria bacterium]|nr:hypothetical protein [Gammaproteobacteria bacterium]